MTKLIVKPNAKNVKELEAAISGNEIGPTGSGLQLDFALESITSFNLGQEAFTNEKVFIQHAVGVETPFDYTKFLTPEMIADMLDEIDNWIKFLEDAVDVAEKATLALTAGCAALSVWSVIAGPSETNLKATYSVCDRVWCPSIPPDCQNVNKVSFDKNNVKYVFDDTKGLYYPEGQTSGGVAAAPGNVAFEQRQNDSLTSYKWVAGDAAKNQYGHKLCPDGMNGVEIRNTATQKGSLIVGGQTTTASSSVRYECTHLDETTYQSSSARSAAVGCYSPGSPKYDDTKCFPWSADDVNNEGEVNTYDDILTSSKCMCVSGVRGHLANYLRVSQGFKKCLQQAQLGEVQGGYCERLFAQFACDLVAWGVKRALGAGDAVGWQPDVGAGAARTIRGNFGTVKENLEARYGGIVQDRLGLSSDQLVHKACVGAITGDWSDLENLFRQAGRIPVEPVIGPMLPESRFTSWNPFTGEAAINYYLTLGVLSGGQEVAGSIKIMCDSRAPGGEYCPGDRPVLIYEENIYIPQDGSLERNLYYEDTRAKYWGNVAVLDLSYKVGGQEKHYQKKDQIRRLNSFVAQCHFQAVPPTIVCETLAGGIAAVEFKEARTTPEVQKYYPGNDVYVRLDAAKADPALLTSDESSATDLYYVYSLVDPNGQVMSNKQNAAELRKWRVTLEDPKEIQIFKVKKFEQGLVSGAAGSKGWYADKQTISSAIDLAAAGASTSAAGAASGNELTVRVEGGTVQGNLSARSIVSMTLLTQDTNQKIDCDTSRVAGEAQCVNTRSQPFTAGRVSYQINAFDTDTVGKISFIKNGALVHEINLVQPTAQRATATAAQGTYIMNVTLYHDVDRNGLITEDDKTVPFGTEQSQTKLVRFNFDPQRPLDCREAPKVEILYPAQRSYRSSSDSALITHDLKTAFTPEGGVIFTQWDDCNDIRYFMLFDSKGFENAQNEIADKESKTGTALSDAEKETMYKNYAIDYTLQANQLSDGSSFMGRGKSLTYNYNAEDRFDLIVRAVDYSGNVGEDRVTVTKTGTLGVVSATPQESQDCARRGGTCKVSCDAAERNLGVCGTGYCCG